MVFLDQSKIPDRQPPDFLDMLVRALAIRVMDVMKNDIIQMIADNRQSIDADEIEDLDNYVEGKINRMLDHNEIKIHADSIEGLDNYFESAVEQAKRNGEIKIDADDVEGLEEFVKDTLKEAQVSIDFV